MLASLEEKKKKEEELNIRKTKLWSDIKSLTEQFEKETGLQVVIDQRHVQYWDRLEVILPF